ncbi:MAG: hypothetical protein WA160_08100 [Pseudobdellovibrio sp.]
MKKNITKYIITISALLIFLLSPDLKAQSVAMIPADVWVKKFNSDISPVSNVFNQTTSFNFLNGQVVSNQVSIGGQFKVVSLSPDTQSDLLNMDILLSQAEVQAKDMQIHIRIEQDFGLGSATVNLNALCTMVKIGIKSVQPVHIQIDKNFQVQKINTFLDKLNLETKIEGCDSIAGLQDEIQKRFLDVLQTQLFERQLKHILTDQINNQINIKIQEVVSKIVETKDKQIKVKIALDIQNKLWVFIGEKAESAFTNEQLAQLGAATTPAVLLKKNDLEQALLANINLQMLKKPILSTENASLQKLTCSRFSQFFVWPALKAFPKCFQLQFISEVKELKLIDLASMKFSVKAISWSQAKDPLKNIAQFVLDADVSLMPSNVKIKSIVGKHDPQFLAWSGRSARISTNLITSTLQGYLQEQLSTAIKNNSSLNPNQIKTLKQLDAETLLAQLK